MTRAIKLTVLIMMIVLPYLYGEYTYRQHLGTVPMQCVKVWEEEHCSKGRNCHYENYGMMLYDNGETTRSYGTYTVGMTYIDDSKWEYLGLNTELESSIVGKIAQVYRWLANFIMMLIGAMLALMTLIATFIWLAFKTRFKNPWSFWVYEFGTELGSSEYEDNKFMDENPEWFYKEER